MTYKWHFEWLCCGCLVLGFAAGCGSSDQVEVFPVRGTVYLDDKPMKGGGAVALVPTTNQAGAAAGGEIKEDGTYELSTYGTGDGSMAGDFKVTVVQSVVIEPEATPDGSKPTTGPVVTVPEAERIPPLYANPLETPVTIKVESKPNEIDIHLKRKP
ncbi:MAG: hypothetical protein AB7O38_07705 [Pirellulaceae bacterium]